MQDRENLTKEDVSPLYKCGLIGLPIKSLKEKRPKFKNWQKVNSINDIPDFAFKNFEAVSISCGASNVLAIDIDTKNDPSGKIGSQFLMALEYSFDNYSNLYIETTPSGGMHILFKCKSPPSNEILARSKESKTPIIETRGKGGQILIHPSPGYDLIQGEIEKLPFFDSEQTDDILSIARSFDEVIELASKHKVTSAINMYDSTWDRYNKETSIVNILTSAGWTIEGKSEKGIDLLRPGKSNNIKSGCVFNDNNLFHCFSTSTKYFKAGKTYNATALQMAMGKSKTDIAKEVNKLYGRNESTLKKPQSPGVFKICLLDDELDVAEKQPPRKKLFGNIWREGELAVLYGQPGAGKSLLGMEMANTIANGNMTGIFNNETNPQPVLYCEFEMSPEMLLERITPGTKGKPRYRYGKNLYRISRDIGSLNGKKKLESFLTEIKYFINQKGAKVLIIDNITALETNMEKAEIAGGFLEALNTFKHQQGISILVIAHTPKKDSSVPIELNHLKGSSTFADLVDSAIALGKSTLSHDIVYLKHVKSRTSQIEFGEDNVAVFIKKWNNHALILEFDKTEPEKYYLRNPTSGDEEKINAVKIIEFVYKIDNGFYRTALAKMLNISRQYVSKVIKEIKSKSEK